MTRALRFVFLLAAFAAVCAHADDADAPAPTENTGADAAQGGAQRSVDQLLRLGVVAGAEQGMDGPASMVIPTAKGNIRIDLQPKAPAAPAAPAPATGPDYTMIGVGIVAALFALSLIMRRRMAAPPVPALHLPDGAYSIVRPLGQGGMGIVYEAIDRKLDRRVAIKRLRQDGSADMAGREELIREAKLVAALRHPNIVDVHSIIEQGGDDYIVFELVEGRTLDELLREHQRLGPRETRGVLSAVCAALEFAHARGVVHRDLKPANIMINAQGQVKVMDFGIARRLGGAGGGAAAVPTTDPRRVDTTQRVMGTPQYLAPEAYYGQVRPESDVYALGVILYRMLSGQLPFPPSAGLKERLERSYTRLALFMPELPAAADALVNDALEPDPEKRIASPKLFGERLAAL